MREQDLPERWRKRVVEHALKTSGGKFRSLSVNDFGNQNVELTFPDGSRVLFRHAFALEEHDYQEIGVFTEHCGYHVFPIVETSVRRFEE